MAKKFYCAICDVSFESGYALAQHFRSKEHRDRLNFGTDSIIEKFIKSLKGLIDESNKV